MNKKSDFDVAAILAPLGAKERDALFTALAYNRATEQTKNATTLQNETWDAVCDALQLPASRRPSVSSFIKTYGASKFDRQIAEIEAYISESCGPMLRKPQRNAVRSQIMAAFARYLRRRGFEASPRIMIDAGAERISTAVDFAFPGYARAGLLHKLAPIAENRV